MAISVMVIHVAVYSTANQLTAQKTRDKESRRNGEHKRLLS
ncbi:MAG: hypothetical protein ABSG75_06820 [Syntrophales bacterium]